MEARAVSAARIARQRLERGTKKRSRALDRGSGTGVDDPRPPLRGQRARWHVAHTDAIGVPPPDIDIETERQQDHISVGGNIKPVELSPVQPNVSTAVRLNLRRRDGQPAMQ